MKSYIARWVSIQRTNTAQRNRELQSENVFVNMIWKWSTNNWKEIISLLLQCRISLSDQENNIRKRDGAADSITCIISVSTHEYCLTQKDSSVPIETRPVQYMNEPFWKFLIALKENGTQTPSSASRTCTIESVLRVRRIRSKIQFHGTYPHVCIGSLWR